jgi:hypothetical protein
LISDVRESMMHDELEEQEDAKREVGIAKRRTRKL